MKAQKILGEENAKTTKGEKSSLSQRIKNQGEKS